MTMTTYDRLLCECGHEGRIRRRENDTPYSLDFWERYSLEELNGSAFITPGGVSMEEVIRHLRPVCPICSRNLSIKNLIQPPSH